MPTNTRTKSLQCSILREPILVCSAYSGTRHRRYTFAVRRMLLCHAEGTNIDQMMLALSTYMSHAEICYTYWYLTAVPELMALAGGKFEHFANISADGDE